MLPKIVFFFVSAFIGMVFQAIMMNTFVDETRDKWMKSRYGA